jgi:hypothetical protein
MSKRVRHLTLILVALGMLAVTFPRLPALASDMDAAAKALVKLDDDWSAAAATKDADRVASYYAENGIAYPPPPSVATRRRKSGPRISPIRVSSPSPGKRSAPKSPRVATSASPPAPMKSHSKAPTENREWKRASTSASGRSNRTARGKRLTTCGMRTRSSDCCIARFQSDRAALRFLRPRQGQERMAIRCRHHTLCESD